MANGYMTNEEYQEYKEERYSRLKKGDGLYLNIAHLMTEMKKKNPKYCRFETDTDWNKNTDCSYETYELYNENDELVCVTSIEYPRCYCEVVEVNENEITLEGESDDRDSIFKLTKEELFIAATIYNGFGWEITF